MRTIFPGLALFLTAISGCAPASGPAPQPTTLPAAAQTFHHPKTGLSLKPPPGWENRPSADYVLRLSPPGVTAEISVDVPELPPHIPGLIPIGLVKNGYVDDVKKAHPDATVGEAEERKVAGANARLVRSAWTENGRRRHETALLTVKGDHVIIFRATCDADSQPATLAAFDEMVQSVEWK